MLEFSAHSQNYNLDMHKKKKIHKVDWKRKIPSILNHSGLRKSINLNKKEKQNRKKKLKINRNVYKWGFIQILKLKI